MNELEVKTSKLQFVLTILSGLFFVPMGFGILYSSISRGFAGVPLFIGLMCLSAYGLVLWLVFRGYRKSVKIFTPQGLTRNDGRQLAWADLSAVVDRIAMRHGGRFIRRIEIRFNGGGAAWLIPIKVNNFAEARAYVNNLPCPHTEENAMAASGY